MKTFVCICLFAVLATALARPHDSDEEHYSDKFDSFNIDELLGNGRLLNSYIDCLLGKGKCTVEGKELKSHMKDAMENDCKKCTAIQKTQTEKVISHMVNHEKESWNELVAKFDPEHTYSKKYEERLTKLKKE